MMENKLEIIRFISSFYRDCRGYIGGSIGIMKRKRQVQLQVISKPTCI